MKTWSIILLVAIGALLPSCGEHGHGVEIGPPTNAQCPSPSTLTYANFGDAFMRDHCRRCHSASVSGDDRQGAPSDHNFDTIAEIRTFAGHIDGMAGSGPGATNELMPPSGTAPTMAQRAQLAEWLACGAPE